MSTPSPPASSTSSDYCQMLTDKEKCNKTIGCSYFSNKCVDRRKNPISRIKKYSSIKKDSQGNTTYVSFYFDYNDAIRTIYLNDTSGKIFHYEIESFSNTEIKLKNGICIDNQGEINKLSNPFHKDNSKTYTFLNYDQQKSFFTNLHSYVNRNQHNKGKSITDYKRITYDPSIDAMRDKFFYESHFFKSNNNINCCLVYKREKTNDNHIKFNDILIRNLYKVFIKNDDNEGNPKEIFFVAKDTEIKVYKKLEEGKITNDNLLYTINFTGDLKSPINEIKYEIKDNLSSNA